MPEINLPTYAQLVDILEDLDVINGNVDSVNTNVDAVKTNVGTNADAASATGSAHSKLKDLKASIGATTDSASATGSVNAKLKDLKSNLVPDSVPFGGTFVSSNMRPENVVTAVNISGKGILRHAVWNYSRYRTTYMKIYIDGALKLVFKNPESDAETVGVVNKSMVLSTFEDGLQTVGSRLQPLKIPYTYKNYPSTASSIGEILFTDGITFKTSLKIILGEGVANSNMDYHYLLYYGELY